VLINSGLSILPNKNVISNIGFGPDPDATHTMNLESEQSKIPRYEISLPIKSHCLFFKTPLLTSIWNLLFLQVVAPDYEY